MKILKYITLIVLIASFCSCEKNEIQYNTTNVEEKAEFQLHYFVPVQGVAANSINRVEIDGLLYANDKEPLLAYNGIPSRGIGLFYFTNPGTKNIKLYQGKGNLVYSQDITLSKGKHNVFIHDFLAPPVVFENGYPYEANVTSTTDSLCWVKFYNFLYEDATTPTKLKLQYQYEDIRTGELVNIGEPIAFAQTTGWQAVKVIKEDENSAGKQKILCKIKVIDDAGVSAPLMLVNAKGVMTEYEGFFDGYIGQRYHHTLGGAQTVPPVASVRTFRAL